MITFFAQGICVQEGNLERSPSGHMYHRENRKTKTLPANRLNDWRDLVAMTARAAGVRMIDGPVRMDVTFYMPRPKHHYGTGRNAGTLKASAPTWHIVAPDRDKLLRAVGDALEGVAYKNDSQPVSGETVKRYTMAGQLPGVRVSVGEEA